MEDAKTRQRRTHSKQLKSEVVAACAEPGASVAAIALARGLNTNLVHKWRRQATRASSRAVTPRKDDGVPAPLGPGFVALPLPSPGPMPEIRIEIRRGAASVAVHWPLSAAEACATWLGTWLR